MKVTWQYCRGIEHQHIALKLKEAAWSGTGFFKAIIQALSNAVNVDPDYARFFGTFNLRGRRYLNADKAKQTIVCSLREIASAAWIRWWSKKIFL
jgi:hypothetical protein